MANKRVFLIAEDDPDDQFLIESVVKEICPANLHLHFVADGIELLKFLQEKAGGQSRPCLIILDLNMPRKDGRQTLKEIKANPGLASIPTVILTTSKREEDVQYCQSFGIDGYYHKPSSVLELREIFGKLCEDYL